MRQAVAAIARFTVIGCHRLVKDLLRNDRLWHIAKLFCNAKPGRYRGMANIEQTSPRSIWLKLPTRAQA
jgi:hypothetical protein